jgi:hypothetical protein
LFGNPREKKEDLLMRKFKKSLDELINKLNNALLEPPDKKDMEQACCYTLLKIKIWIKSSLNLQRKFLP